MQDKKDKEEKQAYEKPKLRVIELLAEEVLGIGWNAIWGGAGVAGRGCTTGICSSNTGS
jgi:hypothetical protein